MGWIVVHDRSNALHEVIRHKKYLSETKIDNLF